MKSVCRKTTLFFFPSSSASWERNFVGDGFYGRREWEINPTKETCLYFPENTYPKWCGDGESLNLQWLFYFFCKRIDRIFDLGWAYCKLWSIFFSEAAQSRKKGSMYPGKLNTYVSPFFRLQLLLDMLRNTVLQSKKSRQFFMSSIFYLFLMNHCQLLLASKAKKSWDYTLALNRAV